MRHQAALKGARALESRRVLPDVLVVGFDRLCVFPPPLPALHRGKLLLQGTLEELARRADASAFQATFLQPPAGDEIEWIGALEGVKGVTASGNGSLELRLTGGPEVQAAVINAIVRSGMPLTSFRPVGTALEQLYLEQIKETER